MIKLEILEHYEVVKRLCRMENAVDNENISKQEDECQREAQSDHVEF